MCTPIYCLHGQHLGLQCAATSIHLQTSLTVHTIEHSQSREWLGSSLPAQRVNLGPRWHEIAWFPWCIQGCQRLYFDSSLCIQGDPELPFLFVVLFVIYQLSCQGVTIVSPSPPVGGTPCRNYKPLLPAALSEQWYIGLRQATDQAQVGQGVCL